MATYLGTSAVFEVRSTATSGNKGGGGFNIANSNFPTDGAATFATGNNPVFSSASYSFVAGDVGAWIYIKSGTNWISGWYQIASVAGGNATLSASVGQSIQINNNLYITNAVAGVATVASPSGATWGIDYSQQNAAQKTATTASGTTTAFTDSTNTPGINWTGNFLCLSTGTGVTAGWYECVSVSAGTVTLDRTAGTSYSAVTYYMGGAVSLGGSTTGITDVIFFALGANATTSGCRFFFKGGSSITYTPNAAITTLVGNAKWPAIYEGYATTRGDRPTGITRPTIACGANTFTVSARGEFHSLQFTGTAVSLLSINASNLIDCKLINSSTSASAAIQVAGISNIISSEIISYRGQGINTSSAEAQIIGCYIHDCDTGILDSLGVNNTIINCIIACCATYGYNFNSGSSAYNQILGNTFYGAENKLGTAINSLQADNNWIIYNNIFYGFSSGTAVATGVNNTTVSNYNDYYNNTTDTSNFNKGSHDVAINPSFTSVSQITGTTATSSGTTLTDSGKNFTTAGVVAGRDFLQVISGTGATVGIYGITAVGTTTLTTDLTIGTSSGGNLVYQITTGRNFAIGTGLKATGFPGTFPGGQSTGYLDIGAVQRQEAASGGGAYTFGF